MARKEVLINVVLLAVTLVYPVVVYLSLGHLEPRWLALLLLGLAGVRLGFSRTSATWGMAAIALALALFAWFSNGLLPIKLYPVAVNAFMLMAFATTLVYPPSAVERLARLREPDLPDSAIAYTRKVTYVWCVFFLLNGSMALILTIWGSDAQWTLYNGALSYVIMGAIALIEWLVRQRVRAQHAAAPQANATKDSHA